jgi:DNA-binding MarR family transcriptional regulator
MAEAKGRADVEFLAELGRVAQLAAARTERLLPQGLSGAGFEALKRLAGDPSSPLALARALAVSKSAMTSMLQTLGRRGWVAIADDPADGRRKQVSITPAGLALCRSAFAVTRPELEQLRAAFPASDFEAALPLLRRLRAWMASRP